ncbi:putative phage protein [Bordetella avium 197N]|uniref:Phage protein n=1 Tax=Bordetella avium (strain 197N) TaxID=360910 RepID=Q2L288_BORA1|nr:putative phage protein [Bordetella avium 197N]
MIGIGINVWLRRYRSYAAPVAPGQPLLINGVALLNLRAPLVLDKVTTISGGGGAQELSGRISGVGPLIRSGVVAALPFSTLVARGFGLADLTSVPAGGLMGQSFGTAKIPAQGYHFRVAGEYKEVQLQAVQDGRVRMVKVRFEDSSDGLGASVVYARDADASELGADFDQVTANTQPVARTYKEAGYGCSLLELDGLPKSTPLRYALADDAVLTVSGDNRYVGNTIIESGTVRVGHVNAFGTGPLMVRGKGVLDRAGFDLPNTIFSGDGTIRG